MEEVALTGNNSVEILKMSYRILGERRGAGKLACTAQKAGYDGVKGGFQQEKNQKRKELDIESSEPTRGGRVSGRESSDWRD